ncbi:MAG: DUF3137 domain-containing protein [Ginsengibacter sp.]
MHSYKKTNTFNPQMNDIKDFESFYSARIEPFLARLNAQSNDASKWSTAGIASVLLAVVCFFMDAPLVAFLLLMFTGFTVHKYSAKKNVLRNNFKTSVINEIVSYLNPGAVYSPSKRMSTNDYKTSGLFNHVYNYIFGEDHITGIYKGVKFYSSELQTSYNAKGTNGRSVNIFEGLFFAAPLNEIFTKATYVWPSEDNQLSLSLADEYFERYMALPKVYRINSDHAAFNKNFVAYTTSPSEARSILDDEMIERIVRFKTQIKRDVRFSFVSGICYVAIEIDENLLEPSVADPGNKENIKEYFFSVLLILSIINQLNLPRFR